MSQISQRVAKAQEYLTILQASMQIDWPEFYTQAVTHENWLFRLAAVHPVHYKDYVWQESNQCKIRGPRGMQMDGGVKVQGCQCRLIWGYDCKLTQTRFEADHLFPYAFGGPSLGQNKVVLCSLHNQAKGSDVHLFPWELGEPVWLGGVLDRIKIQLRYSQGKKQ
jgi:HNH endonuclease